MSTTTYESVTSTRTTTSDPGGKHRPSDVADDRHVMLHQPAVDFERARCEALRDKTPCNPF